MLKDLQKCAVCGKVAPRDKLIVYQFPEGPKLVCKSCFRQLPPDPRERMRVPHKKRGPHDDIFPPVE